MSSIEWAKAVFGSLGAVAFWFGIISAAFEENRQAAWSLGIAAACCVVLAWLSYPAQ